MIELVFVVNPKVEAMFTYLKEDIQTIRHKDPAARSSWEVLTCYPGLHALAIIVWHTVFGLINFAGRRGFYRIFRAG